jgi:hypothetical protein
MPRPPPRVSWKIAGKLFDPPDADGEIFWIVEIDVTNSFPGFKRLGHPTVTFIAGTKSEQWIDPEADPPLTPPIYGYSVEVTIRGKETFNPTHLRVARSWDADGRMCRKQSKDGKYNHAASSDPEAYLSGSLEEGIWRGIITGNVYDQIPHGTNLWQKITPYLLEMSQAPEMRKMEELYLGHRVEHEELHTDVGGYDEGREAASLRTLLEGDTEALKANTPPLRHHLLRMPPPQKIKLPVPVEHYELHTDNSETEYDA